MGYFLGCFGFSCSKKKPRKPATYRVIPADQRHGSYELLNSASTNLDTTVAPLNTDFEPSKKPEEPLKCKIRKKVSFSLNVKTYEPIPREDLVWESDHEEKKKEETGTEAAMKMASYPANYRYRNCIDCYEEDDNLAYEDEDEEEEEEEEEYDYDGNSCIDDLRSSKEEFSRELESLSAKKTQLNQDKSRILRSLDEEGLNSLGMNPNARDRSRFVHSVLNPVENISQWKAVKARGTEPIKSQSKKNVASKSKENVALGQQQQQKVFSLASSFRMSTPLVQEIAVDASLSNWLCSVSDTQSKTKNGNIAVESMGLKKS